MKNKLGDIAIIVAIVGVIGVLLFMKKDAIMEALHIQPKAGSEAAEEVTEEATEAKSAPAEAASETQQVSAPDVGEGIQVSNSLKVTDPLLEAKNVKPVSGPANVPEAGLIENNIMGSSWEELKKTYSYADFEADPDDIAQLRFLDDGSITYYQSPGSGEIFGVEDDNIVAYLKRWKGTPLNEAIGVGGLFDITPYIYQATDQLNFYEWKIANCYVGMLVQDTGDGVEENAPLYAETYVMQRRINTFYK